MKKPNYKKVTLLTVFIILSLCILIFVANSIQDKKEYTFKSKLSFSEIPSSDFTYTDNEKRNINRLLKSMAVEDDSFFGFKGNNSNGINLYNANAVVEMAALLNDYQHNALKERLSFLSNIGYESLDFLNLMYCVNISRILGINVNYSEINDALLSFYDKSLNLFFLDANDEIHTKIIATTMCKEILGENLSEELFDVPNGLRNVYKDYAFLTNNSSAFYNSGADIIYCYYVFGMLDEINLDSLKDWFEYWKNYYENLEINSSFLAISYSEFLNIAKVFDNNYPSQKLHDFYSQLGKEDIEGIQTFYMIFNILKNVRPLDCMAQNTIIENEIDSFLEGKSLSTANIDIKETAFGVVLAQKTDFAMNEEKLQEYIKDNYSKLSVVESNYNRMSMLYYNLILEQAVNGRPAQYDEALLQSVINQTLSDMDNGENSLAAYIRTTRRILEIVMDLQMFDANISLTNSQVKKIKKNISKAISDEGILHSAFIYDIFIIDKALDIGLLSEDTFMDVFIESYADGGNRLGTNAETLPDITTTYQYMTCLEYLGITDYLEQQKAFVNSLMEKEGVYRSSEEITLSFDLAAVLYGNSIKNYNAVED